MSATWQDPGGTPEVKNLRLSCGFFGVSSSGQTEGLIDVCRTIERQRDARIVAEAARI